MGEGPVDPGLIEQHHGHGAERDGEHDLQGEGAGGGVVDGDAVGRIDAGKNDAGIHAEHAEEGQT